MTDKETLFVVNYIATNFNATKAAKLAGYSEVSAYSTGHDLLKKPVIQQAIQEFIESEILSRKEIVYLMSEIAKASYSEYILADGSVDLIGLKRDNKMHLIKKITYTRNGNPIVEFRDPDAMLKTLLENMWAVDPIVSFSM